MPNCEGLDLRGLSPGHRRRRLVAPPPYPSSHVSRARLLRMLNLAHFYLRPGRVNGRDAFSQYALALDLARRWAETDAPAERLAAAARAVLALLRAASALTVLDAGGADA